MLYACARHFIVTADFFTQEYNQVPVIHQSEQPDTVLGVTCIGAALNPGRRGLGIPELSAELLQV